MSLSTGRNILSGALKDLLVKWEKTLEQWNDPMSQELQEQYLHPLDPKVRNATSAMDRVFDLVSKARRDCG